MKTIMLYGHLGKKFGKVHRYHIDTPAEAIRALNANYPEFRQALVDGGAYKILRAGKEELKLEELGHPQSDSETIRIIPVVTGAGRALGSIVLGAALIWASTMLPVTPLFANISVSSIASSMGMSLVLGGVSQMLYSAPSTQNQTVEAVNNRPSFSFDGAVNTAAQGNPVPICYGRLIVGSQVISAGLAVEAI